MTEGKVVIVKLKDAIEMSKNIMGEKRARVALKDMVSRHGVNYIFYELIDVAESMSIELLPREKLMLKYLKKVGEEYGERGTISED